MTDRPKVGVGVMLLKDNRVLLGLRNPDAQKAGSELHGEGTWTMPGGKLDFGEELDRAAIRETQEETGLVLSPNQLRVISITNDKSPDKHYVTIGFFAENFEGEPKVMEPDEITRWDWFALDNLPRPVYPPSLKIIQNYLAKKIY